MLDNIIDRERFRSSMRSLDGHISFLIQIVDKLQDIGRDIKGLKRENAVLQPQAVKGLFKGPRVRR